MLKFFINLHFKTINFFNFFFTVGLVSVEPVVEAKSCDMLLSKTPSITYISSKEKLNCIGTASSVLNDHDGDQSANVSSQLPSLSYPLSLPLATSSLDRGKEQRVAKSTTTQPVCGSLDRAVTSTSKMVPTYVNVLMRNQVCTISIDVCYICDLKTVEKETELKSFDIL